MILDFEVLEKQVADALAQRKEDAKIIFTNHKDVGFVQTSFKKRIYVELAVAQGIKFLRLVPARCPLDSETMVEGRDDIEGGYRKMVSMALNLPFNTTEEYADADAILKLTRLIATGASELVSFELYDEAKVVKSSRELTLRQEKRVRTKCEACGKRLARRQLILHWRGKLFCKIACMKPYVKKNFPDDYLRIDDNFQYIVPEDIGLLNEITLDKLTKGEMQFYHPDKRLDLRAMLEADKENQINPEMMNIEDGDKDEEYL